MKNFQKSAPYLITIIFLFFCLGTFILFFHNRTDFDRQGTNLKNFQKTKDLEVASQSLYEQSFLSKNAGLYYIKIFYKNAITNNSITLTLKNDSDNKIIYQKTHLLPISTSPQALALAFPAQTDSRNKIYQLSIKTNETNNDWQLLTVDQFLYPEGDLFVDSALNDSILVFNFGYQSEKLFELLLSRLTYFSPWLFQNTWSFLILFSIYFVLLFWLVLKLIKTSIESPE